jgi:hypothetical protein
MSVDKKSLQDVEQLHTNILLFGPSRSGKTYLTDEFKNLGLNAFDAEAEGLCQWTNDTTLEVVEYPLNPSKEWLSANHFRIAVGRLSLYIQQKEPVVIFAHAWNILDVIELFDKSYFMYVPPEELERRFLEVRNPEGVRRPHALAFHRERHAERLSQAKERNLPILDMTLSAEQIYQHIMENQD